MNAESNYLSDFIMANMEPILQAWENFAKGMEPASLTMDADALRNHAGHILGTVAKDLSAEQSDQEQIKKAHGHGLRSEAKTSAETHALQRLNSGYTISQLIAEYRALRYAVLSLWEKSLPPRDQSARDDISRFNEAIDQAVAESVAEYEKLTSSQIANQGLRLQAVVNAVPVGIGVADAFGKLMLVNPEFERIWGRHPLSKNEDHDSNLKGWWADGSDKDGQMLSPHDWPLARAIKDEDEAHDIVSIEPFDAPDLRRTIVVRANPVRDNLAMVVGAVVAQMDITEHVKIEKALRESEAKFRTIANAMPQMVWATLPDGQHDYYNQQWYDFTGVPEGSSDGEGWSDLFHPDDRDVAWERWERSLQTGDVYEILYRLRHHSGEYRWTLGRALPVLNDAGTIIRWMGTCTDIHNQKIAEDELRESNKRKDEFLAMLAHELRNPLAPISTAAQLLTRSGTNPIQIKNASEIISRQVKHMTSLVDDLLDVSRVTRGLTELRLENLELHALIYSALEQSLPLMESRQHKLRLVADATLAHVHGDKTRLIQVLTNVLNNAAKYTPQNGEIVLTLEADAAWAKISVKDNGSGIKSTLLPQIFDLFTQGERTPDRGQGGLGLGLALVKSITSLHGGRVEANSDGLGKGTTITIVLPLAIPQNSSFIPQESQKPPSQSLNIVLVDDNFDAADVLKELLELEGHQVTTFSDGNSVLRSEKMNNFQVFILDIGLPDIDGYELARRVRATESGAKATLIALTGYGQEHDRILSKSAGFDHHLVKPYVVSELAELLAEIRS